jgi:hypothetical protein
MQSNIPRDAKSGFANVFSNYFSLGSLKKVRPSGDQSPDY